MNATEQSKEKPASTPPQVKPNTGQGAQRDPAAVGAGPGNQLLDNVTRAVEEEASQPDFKPGAQPDGTASGLAPQVRNEGVE
jgi:hypothetical protein